MVRYFQYPMANIIIRNTLLISKPITKQPENNIACMRNHALSLKTKMATHFGITSMVSTLKQRKSAVMIPVHAVVAKNTKSAAVKKSSSF